MSRLTALYREIGFVGASCYLVNLLTERIFGRRVFFFYEIVAQPVVGCRVSRKNRYVTRIVDDWEQLGSHNERMATPESVIRARFAQSAVCVLLLCDDTLIAYAWLALDGYLEDEVRCHFRPLPPELTAWDFDVYVLPDQRGSLTFARLWDAVNAYLDERQRLWTLSRISRFNSMSIAAHARMGAITLASVLFLVLGPLQVFVSRQRPWIHVSIARVPVFAPNAPVGEKSADP